MDLKVLEVYEGPAKGAADVTITVDDEAIVKISNSELTQEEAVKSGKMKVEGDLETMKKFSALLKKLRDNE